MPLKHRSHFIQKESTAGLASAAVAFFFFLRLPQISDFIPNLCKSITSDNCAW
jgi:hypothetical protein